MRQYKVNGVAHKVYDSGDILPDGLHALTDWTLGNVGDWVYADDESVIQILRRGKMLRRTGKHRVREYVGTCTGTFPITPGAAMDTSKREDIYSFSGRKSKDRLANKKNLSNYENKFIALMATGIPVEEAYLQAFPTNNRKYAFEKSGTLMKTERVRTAMKEELKPVLEELGISDKSVLRNIKHVAQNAEKEDVRLRALFKLSDILDLEDKNSTKITQVTGALFKGFSNTEIESVARPKELGE